MRDIDIHPSHSQISLDDEFHFLAMRTFPKIIGLTGPTKTGKSSIAKMLVVTYGFEFISLSVFLANEAKRLGASNPEWKQLGETGIKMRMALGKDILARHAVEFIRNSPNPSTRFVIDCLLHPDEIKYLFERTNALILGINADAKTRLGTYLEWSGEEMKQGKKSLLLRDRFEQWTKDRGEKNAPNIKDCMSWARKHGRVINVSGKMNYETLYKPVDDIVREYLFS